MNKKESRSAVLSVGQESFNRLSSAALRLKLYSVEGVLFSKVLTRQDWEHNLTHI